MNARQNLTPVPVAPVEEIVAEIQAGRMVILVDEEDRENEGDLVLAADHVTPEAVNFMARFPWWHAMAPSWAPPSPSRSKQPSG
jgi:hypothetical protein